MKSLIFFLFFCFISVENVLMIQHPKIAPLDAYFLNKSECLCRLGANARIVGGAPIRHHVPWQASIAQIGYHYCGGVIVNNYYVMTAAHCVAQSDPINVTVLLGSNILNEYANDSDVYHADELIMYHPIPIILMGGSFKDDIALIKLKEPINFRKGYVEPACINIDEQRKYRSLIITGWGAYETSTRKLPNPQRIGNSSQELKEAFAYEDHSANCAPNMICTSSPNGDSSCHGDSGGPIHSRRNGKLIVEGLTRGEQPRLIAPYIYEWCHGNTKYVRLSSYKSWIGNYIGDNYCNP